MWRRDGDRDRRWQRDDSSDGDHPDPILDDDVTGDDEVDDGDPKTALLRRRSHSCHPFYKFTSQVDLKDFFSAECSRLHSKKENKNL